MNKNAIEGLKKAINKKNPSAVNARAIYDEEFEMYIDTTNIIVNETPDSESITMSVLSEEDLTKIENLVLVLNEDGGYKAFLSEYILTQAQIDIITNGGTLENVTPTSITDLDSTSKISITGPCIHLNTITYDTCTDSDGNTIIHQGDSGNDCEGNWGTVTYETISVDLHCLSGSGGGSSNSSSGSGDAGDSAGDSGNSYDGSSPTGGYSSSSSSIYNSIMELLNTTFIPPCTDCFELTEELSNFISTLSNNDQLTYWNDLEYIEQKKFIGFLNQNNYSPEAINFVIELIDYLIANPTMTWDYVMNNKTSFDSNQAETGTFTIGDYDNTNYDNYDPFVYGWPNISPVIEQDNFVGWGTAGIPRNCFDYAKAQIAKKGYQISNYYAPGQTIQVFTSTSGVNSSVISDALSYITYALTFGIPVIVGVDDAPGHPGNLDGITDHFIVIVGMGVNSNGTYFQFYDNASSDVNQGTNPLNLLYYNPSTGIFNGFSQTDYAQNQPYNYTMTMIRKSKPL